MKAKISFVVCFLILVIAGMIEKLSAHTQTQQFQPNFAGGQYRPNEGVGIEKCIAGGYDVGWTRAGEWMAYTVTVGKSASYEMSFYVSSAYDSGKLHLECDGADKTGTISIPNTVGFQNWEVVKKTVSLDAGQHFLKLVVDGDYSKIDKMVFEEI